MADYFSKRLAEAYASHAESYLYGVVRNACRGCRVHPPNSNGYYTCKETDWWRGRVSRFLKECVSRVNEDLVMRTFSKSLTDGETISQCPILMYSREFRAHLWHKTDWVELVERIVEDLVDVAENFTADEEYEGYEGADDSDVRKHSSTVMDDPHVRKLAKAYALHAQSVLDEVVKNACRGCGTHDMNPHGFYSCGDGDTWKQRVSRFLPECLRWVEEHSVMITFSKSLTTMAEARDCPQILYCKEFRGHLWDKAEWVEFVEREVDDLHYVERCFEEEYGPLPPPSANRTEG